MSPLRNSKKGCSEKNDVRFPELILLHRSLKEEKKTKSDILISTTVANGEYFYTIFPFKLQMVITPRASIEAIVLVSLNIK